MCLGNWLFKELLSSSRCICLRLWIDLSQQQNHGESQGDSRFPVHICPPSIPCSSLPFFPGGVFCISAQEVHFHGLFFSCFPGWLVSPVSLQLAWKACELPDFGQCLHQDFRQFWFCRKPSSVSHLLHPGFGSGDQTCSTCTYQLISVPFFFFTPNSPFSFCHFEP